MNAIAEDIWKILQEVAQERQKEAQERQKAAQERQEAAQERQEAAQERQEAAQERKEISAMFKETDLMFKETSLSFKETDLKFKETDKEITRIAKEIEKVNVIVGRLGNKLGDFVEEMVRPAAIRLFRERGIDVHEIYQNVNSQRGDEGIEIDLLVVNDTDVIAIECKSTLGIDDVNEHFERLAKLKRLLPAYAKKRVLGAVSGMVIPDNVARYAYKKGFFVITQSGDQMLIRNDAQFIPQVW